MLIFHPNSSVNFPATDAGAGFHGAILVMLEVTGEMDRQQTTTKQNKAQYKAFISWDVL